MKTYKEVGTPSANVLRRLALQAAGMTGADIARVVREARQTARRAGRPLTHADLEQRLVGTRPARSPSMRRRIAIHESGHILVRVVYGFGEISLVTINGRDGYGYVESTADDALVQTETGLTHLIQVFLAGRAAEHVIYGDALAGSGGSDRSDLARASNLAYMLEASLGYGSRTPLLYRDPDDGAAELRLDPELAVRVNVRLEQAYGTAGELIRRHRAVLQYLSDTLMRHGTLEGAELAAVLADARIKVIDRLRSTSPDGANAQAADDANCN